MALVTVVRVYLNERESNIKSLLKYLHNEMNIQGATVFRGIAGYGQSGAMHQTSIVDLDMDLPIIVEFFDEPTKIENAIERVKELVEPSNILHWTANDNRV